MYSYTYMSYRMEKKSTMNFQMKGTLSSVSTHLDMASFTYVTPTENELNVHRTRVFALSNQYFELAVFLILIYQE